MVWPLAIAFLHFFRVSIFSLLIKIAIIIKWVACYFREFPLLEIVQTHRREMFRKKCLPEHRTAFHGKTRFTMEIDQCCVSVVTILLLLILKISSSVLLNKSKEMGWSLIA